MGSDVQIKKIKPYPFNITLVRGLGGETIKGSVVKLSQHGFLVEIIGFLPIVRDDYQGKFKLPTIDFLFDVKLIVVKTYDSFRSKQSAPHKLNYQNSSTKEESTGETDKKVSGTIHLAEMHFVRPSAEQSRHLTNWLKTIGQIKT